MIKINMDRLVSNLQTLGKIGLNESGGLDRTAFTDAELQARNWLFEKLNAINLTVKVDEIANIWAKREGSNPKYPSIVFGSHIDSVPNGGKYDGALGVLMALEVMQTLEENGIQTTYPLELVSFSAEEANPFGVSTLGSRAAAGKLKQQDIFNAINDEGMTLTQALQKAGGDPVHFEKAKRNPNELAAYLEVHIEQGKRLLNREIPVGIVTGITGIYREQVTVSGEANHAGTTLMKDRTDALMQASEMMLAFETAVKDYPDEELVGTIGKIENYPNAANVIPGQVELHIEIRGGSRDAIQDVINKWEKS